MTSAPWLWTGTWSMGGEGFGPHDERESLKVLELAVENGIRHFDTAGFYAHGRSEELLRKIVRTDREKFFISTKGGLVWDGRRVVHRAAAGELRAQLLESLERLKTDYIDLYQLHWPDPEVPLQESINALKVFQREGLIRYWGVGNLTEKQVMEHLAGEKDIPHQVHFNPVHRSRAVLDAGRDCCINCIISPLEQGLLGSGRSSKGKEGIGKKDIRNRNPYFTDQRVMEWSRRLEELVKDSNLSKVSVVLMWICAQPHVHALIPGPRKERQMKEILEFRAVVEDNNLSSDDEAEGILSAERVREMMGAGLWKCLEDGPMPAGS